MFLMRAFMLPFNVIPPHYGGKLFFFGLYPLRPLGITTGTAFKSLRRQHLFQRYFRIKPTLAASRERDKINMKMRRCFVNKV